MRRLSRRTFLKLSGVAATVATAGTALPQLMGWAANTKIEGTTGFRASICEMCSVRCSMQGKVVDGKLVVIEGNPKFGGTGGTLCARGIAGQSLLNDPQRLKQPMIRTGERGEGKWKEVSWDEAYDYIAQKMKEIKEQHGAESVAFAARSGLHNTHFFNLARAYGSPNVFGHDSTCPLSRDVALSVTFGTPGLAFDYSNVRYFLSLGRSYFEGIHVAQVRGIMGALNKGAKMVVADPRYSVTAAKAHEWFPVKPGSDLALVLAINHVLIRDGLYDKDFIEKYTVGFDQVRNSVQQYTPQWAEQETGIKAADIERIARELAAVKPRGIVDWGWRTCSSTEDFELRRASIIANLLLGAFEVPGGMCLVKTAGFINGMAGKELVPDLKGPKLPAYPALKPRVDGAGIKGHPNQFVMPGSGVVHQIPDFILTGKPYPIKGWFVYRYNPVCTQTDANRVVEAIKKLDLMVVCDVYMSDTAWYADVVLPESTYLERDEGFNNASGFAPVYTLRQQIVKPLHSTTKPHWQIFREIGAKLGLDAYFPWKEIDEFRLAQLSGRADLLKKAKEDGFITAGMKPLILRDRSSVEQFVKLFPEMQKLVNEQGIIEAPLLNLRTPSKKIELFSSNVEQAFPGRGVPVYRPVTLKKDNELFFIQGKIAINTNGATHNIPWLHGLMPYNRLWVHPETAKKHGITDGSTVEMASPYGQQQVKAFVTQGVRPDTVFAYFGFGRVSPGLKRAYKQGVNANMMLPTYTAHVGAGSVNTAGVTIKKV